MLSPKSCSLAKYILQQPAELIVKKIPEFLSELQKPNCQYPVMLDMPSTSVISSYLHGGSPRIPNSPPLRRKTPAELIRDKKSFKMHHRFTPTYAVCHIQSTASRINTGSQLWKNAHDCIQYLHTYRNHGRPWIFCEMIITFEITKQQCSPCFMMQYRIAGSAFDAIASVQTRSYKLTRDETQ